MNGAMNKGMEECYPDGVLSNRRRDIASKDFEASALLLCYVVQRGLNERIKHIWNESITNYNLN